MKPLSEREREREESHQIQRHWRKTPLIPGKAHPLGSKGTKKDEKPDQKAPAKERETRSTVTGTRPFLSRDSKKRIKNRHRLAALPPSSVPPPPQRPRPRSINAPSPIAIPPPQLHVPGHPRLVRRKRHPARHDGHARIREPEGVEVDDGRGGWRGRDAVDDGEWEGARGEGDVLDGLRGEERAALAGRAVGGDVGGEGGAVGGDGGEGVGAVGALRGGEGEVGVEGDVEVGVEEGEEVDEEPGGEAGEGEEDVADEEGEGDEGVGLVGLGLVGGLFFFLVGVGEGRVVGYLRCPG